MCSMVCFRQVNKEISVGGILMPETATQDNVFEVIAVGEDVNKIKKGQFIVFRTTDAIRVDNEGVDKDTYLIDEEHIVAIIELGKEISELKKIN